MKWPIATPAKLYVKARLRRPTATPAKLYVKTRLRYRPTATPAKLYVKTWLRQQPPLATHAKLYVKTQLRHNHHHHHPPTTATTTYTLENIMQVIVFTYIIINSKIQHFNMVLDVELAKTIIERFSIDLDDLQNILIEP